MADWAYIPMFPYNVQRSDSVLINEFEDGTETRRQKHSNIGKVFSGRYAVNRPTLSAMMDFHDAKLTFTSFTIIGYDANDGTWGTTEYTVRFFQMTDYDQIGPAPAAGGLGYVVPFIFKRLF